MSSETYAGGIGGKIMLVGVDNNHIFEKRYKRQAVN